jgi:chemotaxis signal transduction protein
VEPASPSSSPSVSGASSSSSLETASPSSSGASSPSGSGASSRPAGESSRRTSRREGLYACVFWLGGQRYALDTATVLEAITLTQLVPVPLSPSWLIGLTSLRGTPLPVVDLPTVLALPAPDAGPASESGQPALVLRVEGLLLSGRVDRIEAVYPFASARLEPVVSAAEHPAVRGLLEVGKAAVPATLLDHAELSRRVSALRFGAQWKHGIEGEGSHGTKAGNEA